MFAGEDEAAAGQLGFGQPRKRKSDVEESESPFYEKKN